MPKYTVYLETCASTAISVEADNKEEAYERALEEAMPNICAQCSGWGNSQNLELGDEWDLPVAPSTEYNGKGPELERIEYYVMEDGE